MKPPIFIFGVPRSGTTLLRTILNCHPHIACGPEAPWLADHIEHNVMNLYQTLVAGELSYCENFQVGPSQVGRRMRQLVEGLFEDFARSHGKPRWAHKTPDDCLFVDFFAELFPDASFIHLTRDPLDVAVSNVTVAAHRTGINPWHEKNMLLEANCAVKKNLFNSVVRWRRWNDKIRRGLANVDHMCVRYEDMVGNPHQTFQDIFAFLDEPFDPRILEYGNFENIFPEWEWGSADVRLSKSITAASVGRWKKEVTPEQAEVLLSIAGPEQSLAREQDARSLCALARREEYEGLRYRYFMEGLNEFAAAFSLEQSTVCPAAWAYPWLWFGGLSRVEWSQKQLVDIGSQLSPIPWLIAMMGATVTLVGTDSQWVGQWEDLRRRLKVNVDWHVSDAGTLPGADESVDVVTSFSAIEHQDNKQQVIEQIVRVLAPNGMLAMSFAVGEQDSLMTVPEFEDLVWLHPAFGNRDRPEWHIQSTPRQDCTVAAAVLRKGKA